MTGKLRVFETLGAAFSAAFSLSGFVLSLITAALFALPFSATYLFPQATQGLGLLATIAVVFASLLYAVAAIRILYHNTLRPSTILRAPLRSTLRLLATGLIAGIITTVGLILLVIPGIIAYTGLYVAIAYAAINDASPWAAITKSWNATTGSKLAIFGLAILTWVITTAASLSFQATVVFSAFTTGTSISAAALTGYVAIYAQIVSLATMTEAYKQLT